jgi:hypothetical protein
MNAPCPYCRKELDLMEIFHESDTSAIIQMLPSFGKHAHAVMGYCYLFGVTPFRLKAKKLRLLLDELKRLFDAESFSFEKRLYGISHAGIAEALDVMIKRNFDRTLHNHNYLKAVMIAISEREGKAAGKQAEKDLRKKEVLLMSGSDRGHDAEARRDRIVSPEAEAYPVPEERVEAPPLRTMPRTAPLSDAEIEANRQRLKKMVAGLGEEKPHA